MLCIYMYTVCVCVCVCVYARDESDDENESDDEMWALAVNSPSEGRRRWGAGRELKLFHGTSWENAQKIAREGFLVSEVRQSLGALG